PRPRSLAAIAPVRRAGPDHGKRRREHAPPAALPRRHVPDAPGAGRLVGGGRDHPPPRAIGEGERHGAAPELAPAPPRGAPPGLARRNRGESHRFAAHGADRAGVRPLPRPLPARRLTGGQDLPSAAMADEGASPPRTPAPIVFVGGTGRSGTHVIARLLGRSMDLAAIPVECRFHAEERGFPGLLSGQV